MLVTNSDASVLEVRLVFLFNSAMDYDADATELLETYGQSRFIFHANIG